ncbi:MAG: ECF transporter S component [Lachnospiraceae bacterium]|nr:ECF transporter S component [Lachnospiraceae bacterium]
MKKYTTKEYVELALLIAVVAILSYTPLGYIKTFGFEITTVVVPVAVGAVTLGPGAGAILGAAFGLMSLSRWMMGMSALGAALFSINPLATFVVCVVARTLMGWLTGILYKAFVKVKFMKKGALVAANLCAPLLNTTFFMGFMVLFFYNTDYIQNLVETMGAANPFMFVIAFVGLNGLVEALVCFVIGSAVSKALKAALR